MKKHEIALLIGLAVSIFLTSIQGFAGEAGDIRDNMLRLHILANSDSEADQELKLAVRDAVLLETAGLFQSGGDKEQAKALARKNLSRIEEIAACEIARQGCDYPVKAEVVNMFFDTRQYGDITIAAGRYDAVRITIGQGAGKNWWCVMFPPMCIPAAEADPLPLEDQITNLGQPPKYKAKFAVVEAVETFGNWISGLDEDPA